MKRYILFIACLLTMFIQLTAHAANVTKVVITTQEPAVGEVRSFKASVPETASTEIYDVKWEGDFKNDRFVLGKNYTMIVGVRIKSSSSNRFSTSSNINVTINGHKARVTEIHSDRIWVKYTWKSVGGEDPEDPQYKLKTRLNELASKFNATNASDDKEVLKYIKSELPAAEVWSTGGAYKFTRRMPSETADGHINVPIGITYKGATLENYNFKAILPALNKSPESLELAEDMELMKTALKYMMVTAKTKGDDILDAVNAAAIHGTKAIWDENYKYNAPTSELMGSIDGNLILALGDKKESFHAHKTLPIDGDRADAAIDADFSVLSKFLHGYAVSNRTTQKELMNVANAAMTKGSTLTCTEFIKTESTVEKEGKIVMYFELEYKDKRRSPRIAMRIPKLEVPLPPGLAVTQAEWEALRHINIRRYKERLTLLTMASPLQDAAHARAAGSSFAEAIDPVFISHRTCIEQLYTGSDLPSVAIKDWMKNPSHKAIILKDDYCYIGIGKHSTVTTNTWSQIFVGSCTVIDVESSSGVFYFNTIEDMEKAYVICNMGYHTKGYIPFDTDYMIQDGHKFTLRLKGKSVTVHVMDIPEE